jgi:hypothetical protein
VLEALGFEIIHLFYLSLGLLLLTKSLLFQFLNLISMVALLLIYSVP